MIKVIRVFVRGLLKVMGLLLNVCIVCIATIGAVIVHIVTGEEFYEVIEDFAKDMKEGIVVGSNNNDEE